MAFTKPSVQVDVDHTVSAIVEAMRSRINDADPYIAMQARLAPVIGEITRGYLTAYNEGEDAEEVISAILAVVASGLFNIIKGSVDENSNDPVHDAIHGCVDEFSRCLHDARAMWRDGAAETDGSMDSVKIKTSVVGHG